MLSHCGQIRYNILEKTIRKMQSYEILNEMVQGPCAHVVLHDRIYVDFTDLLTVIAQRGN
jgi:hypothetical protein